MKSKIGQWYLALSNGKKLVVLFILQFVYWAFAWWLFKKVWPDEEPYTWGELLIDSLWMAVWMTTLFHWKKVKQLFSKSKQDDQR